MRSCRTGPSLIPPNSIRGWLPHPTHQQGQTQGSSPADDPLGQRDWKRAQAEPPIAGVGSLGPTRGRIFLCGLLTYEVLNEFCTLPQNGAGTSPVGFGGSSLCPAPLEEPALLSPLS